MTPLRNSLAIKLLAFAFLGIAFLSCSENETPKPRAYFRIDLPEKKYTTFDTSFPYTFEYPVYGKIIPRNDKPGNSYWMNLEFPAFKGTLYISYLDINGNLDKLLNDSRELVNKHIPKANAIEEIDIVNTNERVFGTLFDIRGNNAASSYQFYVTDSNHHFVRGALYFKVKPNNDSLSPVIDFLRVDIDHLIRTFKWKQRL